MSTDDSHGGATDRLKVERRQVRRTLLYCTWIGCLAMALGIGGDLAARLVNEALGLPLGSEGTHPALLIVLSTLLPCVYLRPRSLRHWIAVVCGATALATAVWIGWILGFLLLSTELFREVNPFLEGGVLLVVFSALWTPTFAIFYISTRHNGFWPGHDSGGR